jgi:ATPase family AAA domain-containing protein 3A/B
MLDDWMVESSLSVVQRWASSSNPSPSPQSSLPSSSVQSQPSILPQSTAAGNLELLGMASAGFDTKALER